MGTTQILNYNHNNTYKMDLSVFQKLQFDNLVLNKVSHEDIAFIKEAFSDADIKKYYIISKELNQNYERLIDCLIRNIESETGYTWIISQKGNGAFQPDIKCGFITFKYRNSFSTVTINYALIKQHRGKGIMSKSLFHVLEVLRELGVESIEADIDRDNIGSERVVERLGFTADKRTALVDPEMFREGVISIRALWQKKLLNSIKARFYIIKNTDTPKFFNSDTIFKVDEEPAQNQEIPLFMHFEQPQTTGKYYMVFTNTVTEKLVGLSSNDEQNFLVPWELKREEELDGHKFLIFSGWGDTISGGNLQFEGYEIAIDKRVFANIIMQLISINSDYFSVEKMQKLVGLEGFRFQNGTIYI